MRIWQWGLGGGADAIQPRTQQILQVPFLSEFSSLWSCLVCGPQATGCVLTHLTAGHTPFTSKVFWFGQCIPQSLFFGVKVGMLPLGENQRLPRQLFQTSQATHCGLRSVQLSPLCQALAGHQNRFTLFYSEELADCHVPGTVRHVYHPHSVLWSGYCCHPQFFGCGTWKPERLTT